MTKLVRTTGPNGTNAKVTVLVRKSEAGWKKYHPVLRHGQNISGTITDFGFLVMIFIIISVPGSEIAQQMILCLALTIIF